MPLTRKHWPLIALPAALVLAACAKLYLDRPVPPSDPDTASSFSKVEDNRYVGTRTHAPPPSSPATQTEYSSHATYSQVEENLYVGGRTTAPPPDTAAVLSMSYNPDLYKVKFHQYSSIPDGKPAPSLDWLKRQVAFIDQHQKSKEVTFVHCDAGISRGPSVTAAYLMFEHHWTRDQALAFLKEKRPQIYPNIYFMDLLIDYEEDLKNTTHSQPPK